MHCELVVPGLFAVPPEARLASLELMLARGRCAKTGPQPLEAWLHAAFGLGTQPLAAGALTLLAAGGQPGDALWARVDPVHLRLMRDRLILAPTGVLQIKLDEARALCEALNGHFSAALEVTAVDAERWCARLHEDFGVQGDPPLEISGRDVDLHRPAGSASSRWPALLNEAQMLLHGHPVNEAREARSEPVVNSVWLWGVGRLPTITEARWHSVAANEPVALGLARRAQVRHAALPASASEWLERAPDDGRHLLVLDQLRMPLALSQVAEYREAVAALERDWFTPLLRALRSGRVGMVTLHVPDAAHCAAFETIRGDLRRFWRRPRALEHYA